VRGFADLDDDEDDFDEEDDGSDNDDLEDDERDDDIEDDGNGRALFQRGLQARRAKCDRVTAKMWGFVDVA
jgi:hypothetical protein